MADRTSTRSGSLDERGTEPVSNTPSSRPDRIEPAEADGGARSLFLRWIRVPHRPEPPPGDPEQLRVFRAGRNYFRYKLIGWGIGQTVALIALLVSTVGIGVLALPFNIPMGDTPDLGEAMGPSFAWLSAAAILATWGLFISQAVFSFVALKLDWEMRWYVLSDRALRIRHGVFTVREQTMTYANIQQISVRRGPLQSLLGLGDVEVRTAGGGGGPKGQAGAKAAMKDLHRGFFKGVENPDGVRDAIRGRVEAYRDAGLGDPDERRREVEPMARAEVPEAAPPGAVEEATKASYVLGAARLLLDEVAALRGELSGSGG